MYQKDEEIEYENYCPDFTKPGKEMLIDLLNYANRNNMQSLLTPETVFFTDPKSLDKNCEMNTSIRIAKVLGFYIPQDSEEIHYNRVDIAQVCKIKHFNHVIYLKEGLLTKEEVVHAFNDASKIKLVLEDVDFTEVELSFKGLEKVRYAIHDLVDEYQEDYIYPKLTITMSSKSIAYYGKMEVEVRPVKANIDNVLKVRKLKPFIPPFRGGHH